MSSPYTPMDTVPLTASASAPTSQRRREQQQQQPSGRGWSSSMALFSPQPVLSESSSNRRPQQQSDAYRNEPFKASTVSRTVSNHYYGGGASTTASPTPTNNSVTFQSGTVYPASSMSHDYDDDEETDASSPRLAKPALVNPWIIPHVESIEAPMSTTSSASNFGFCRRSTIRLELSKQGSVSQFLDGEEHIDQVSLHSTLEGVEVAEVEAPPEDYLDLESPCYSNDSTEDAETQSYYTSVTGSLSGLWHTVSSNVSRLGHVSWLLPGNRHNDPQQWASSPSPMSEPTEAAPLRDLQKTHREKISVLQQSEALENMDQEDLYDFCLVLTPLQVYSFWADLLDFQAEHLGEAATIQHSSSSTETEETDGSDSDNNVPIDARPFLTPQTGMRRRRLQNSPDVSALTKDDANNNNMTGSSSMRPSLMAPISEQKSHATGMSVRSQRVKPRLSMFEKAVGTPSYIGTPSRQSIAETPSIMSSRRRWGNRHDMGHTPDLPTSPHTNKMREMARKRSLAQAVVENKKAAAAIDQPDESLEKRFKSSSGHEILYDIPSQVIPRGIAARTNGMMQFLSALKRGFVVRRHRPSSEAMFYKIYSSDGGDTIKLEPVLNTQEAMLAFREQRLRYNKKAATSVPVWSEAQHSKRDELQNFRLPDYIAAEQYRRRKAEREKGLKKSVMDVASKLKKNSTIRTADVIAVHPGRHEDPRCRGAVGTSTLRKSKSDYDGQHCFSIVTRANRHIQASKLNRTVASEKWHAGEGNDAQFKLVDLEAATEGEYWLVFRGFLLLHRDAASGRFASNRAAGFGSKSNRRDDVDVDAEGWNRLQVDAFHEPKIISRLEKFVANRIRKVDLTVALNGAASAGAVPPPSDYFLGFKSAGTQIWSRLRQAGLETTRIYAIDTKRVMIKIRCPADRLRDVAEVLRIKVKTRGGKFAPFRENDMPRFQPLNDELDAPKSIFEGASLFRSSERQQVIDFVIRSRIRDSGSELGQTTDLGKMIQARVPLHMHRKRDSVYHAWFFFWKRQNWMNRDGRSMTVGNDSTRFNLNIDHHVSNRRVPPNTVSRFLIGTFFQPLDSIEQYFGEKVTFYFAWLQHASYHLIFLSIIGFFVFICQISSGKWDHPIRPYFSLVIMLWSFVVLVNWRKRQSFLAHRWGTVDHKVQETTRPQFKGEYKRDPITGEWIVYYPSWKRYVKYLISFPITVAFTMGTLIVILLVHANRDQLLARYFEQKESPGSDEFEIKFRISAIGEPKSFKSVEINKENLQDPKFWFIIGGLPSLLGLCLPLLNFILMRISVMLTDFENYRTESHYRSALIIKVFSFRFVCYFATLYYYCFLSVVSDAIEEGILRVGTGVFIYTTVAHWWGAFIQMYFPLLIYSIRRRNQKKRLREELMQVELEESELEDLDKDGADNEDIKAKKIHLVNKRLLLDQAQDELWKEVMLPQHDSFPEYIQGVVQFAYVTCFSVVLPITPIICLINHLVSMRLDAYKLCKTRRRPLAQKTGGIGIWEHVLHVVTVIGVLTNCALMGFTTSQFRQIAENIDLKGGADGNKNGEIALFAIVVGWEHIMLLIKYVMQTSISKLPQSVRDENKRDSFETERKRNSSMRQKKDRRMSSRGAGLFGGSPGMGETPPRSGASSKYGPSRLTTIPSEDISENGTPSTAKQNGHSSDIENQEPLQYHSRPPLSNRSKRSSDSDSFRVPTPLHLGGTLAAEAKAAEAEALLDSPFSVFACQSRIDLEGDDSIIAETVESEAVSDFLGSGIEEDSTSLPESDAVELDDANALAAARINARLGDLERKVSKKMMHKKQNNTDLDRSLHEA